ncbi:NAD-dependent epimerase/dehydratase family protein [Hyphomicrobium sp. LHD-15]|uniref:NAD-dependent epimerase/dehydratase family protein n=1 Tax=Hyphomicrobium sp. LHD-15 TaxID=3072142 RepID=UPI00280CFFDE|nr:NAD-dependent epimerase/dehydratase family protein [Hyphomicrobium sp. LHD-15]MDQ8699863.1 NAD-dependent epimerase/dehydratase family protein [Hyphomicrobium sp. LHD-15]
MRILVTGAAGFVGVAACKALSESGHRVTAVTRSPTATPLAAERIAVLGDLTGATDWSDVLVGIDAVVHLAGRAHVLNDDAREAERLYRQANVEVLEGLARAAVAAGVKRLAFASSIKVNGEETFGVPFSADRPPAPEDAYGKSKLEAEQRLREIAGTAMEWVILRPPLMYGPGVRGNMARLYAIADRGWPVPFGSIRNARDLLYVGSFADLIVRAVSAPAAANRVFLARDGEPLSTPDLFRSIAGALGKRPILLPCPVSMLELIGRLTGRTAEVRRLTGNLEIDDGETRRLLAWEPRVSAGEAMKLTADGYRSRQ